jgi:Cu(I)/Ag(I) efflux system membrane fusion protein
VFRGTVAFKDPALNPATRTLNVRYDLENPDGRLRPGMFATVTLRTPVAETPAFRGRLAEAGEGRDLARLASLTVDEQKVCLVTNAKLGSMGDPVPVDVQGKGLWMCCKACEEKLRGQPTRYLARLAPPPSGSVLSVPESAVIDTGSRKLVFVEAEPGVYEAREVVLGARSGSLFPVLDGLLPGEKVATAGAFLLDAETRLNAATIDTPPAAEPRPTRTAAAPGAGEHRH